MASSISGSTGQAGTVVSYQGSTTAAQGQVTANGSGSYTIPALADDTYLVTPAVAGNKKFTPFAQNVVVAGSNVTGINFVSSGSLPVLTFTSQATDNFTPNANPLNPAKWTPSQDGEGKFEALQALNATCIPSTTDNADFCAYYTGIAAPGNQYAQYKLNNIIADGESGFFFFMRSTLDGFQQYEMAVFNNGDGTTANAAMALVTGDDVGSNLCFLNSFAYTLGDVFAAACIGTDLYLLQNGVVILYASDATYSSGHVGLDLDSFTSSLTNVIISNFQIGSASQPGSAYSVPDDRDYSIFPNNAVTVQGTQTYTVPSQLSHPAPVDSRKADPIDSREAAIIPENSRNTPH